MRLPVDQVSSPTYNADLARASADLVERRLSGLWNVAGPDEINRYQFAILAARILGLDASLLKPATTAELRQKAGRPLGAGLKIGKLLKALGWSPRSAQAGLEAFAALQGQQHG